MKEIIRSKAKELGDDQISALLPSHAISTIFSSTTTAITAFDIA